MVVFHGSKLCNWYSILKHGLQNVSNTHMMTSGAAYGQGIYLSRHYGTSLGYCGSAYSSYSSGVSGSNSQAAAVTDAGVENRGGEELQADEREKELHMKKEEFSSKLKLKEGEDVCSVLGVCELAVDASVRHSGSILVAPRAELVVVTHLIVALQKSNTGT